MFLGSQLSISSPSSFFFHHFFTLFISTTSTPSHNLDHLLARRHLHSSLEWGLAVPSCLVNFAESISSARWNWRKTSKKNEPNSILDSMHLFRGEKLEIFYFSKPPVIFWGCAIFAKSQNPSPKISLVKNFKSFQNFEFLVWPLLHVPCFPGHHLFSFLHFLLFSDFTIKLQK